MAEYDNRVRSVGATGAVAIDEGLRAYMLRVYNYMLMGLALTGATAWIALNTPLGALFFSRPLRAFRCRRSAGSRCSRRWDWCSS